MRASWVRRSPRDCAPLDRRWSQSAADRDSWSYVLEPAEQEGYTALWLELTRDGVLPHQVVHLWTLEQTAPPADLDAALAATEGALSRGFYSLLALARMLGSTTRQIEIVVVTGGMQPVLGDEPLRTELATVLGPIKVIPQEYPHLRCRSIDLDCGKERTTDEALLELLLRRRGVGVVASDRRQASGRAPGSFRRSRHR